jgi:hypothetical protein
MSAPVFLWCSSPEILELGRNEVLARSGKGFWKELTLFFKLGNAFKKVQASVQEQ